MHFDLNVGISLPRERAWLRECVGLAVLALGATVPLHALHLPRGRVTGSCEVMVALHPHTAVYDGLRLALHHFSE